MSSPFTRKGTSMSQVITGLCHSHRSAVRFKNIYLLAKSRLIWKNMPSLWTTMDVVPVEALRHNFSDFTMT